MHALVARSIVHERIHALTDNVRSMLRSWLPTGLGSSPTVLTAGAGFTLGGVCFTRGGGVCLTGRGRDCAIGRARAGAAFIALWRVGATVAASGWWRAGGLMGVVVGGRCAC